ncbi:hypothetical protein [Leptolyngbya sp. CCY15150]|nr:hypothetical protein [Leptolyngbya sp. CCY15150]
MGWYQGGRQNNGVSRAGGRRDRSLVVNKLGGHGSRAGTLSAAIAGSSAA